ncbi:MAG: Hsp70 family protein [Deltaproteobacteria bacterium]|nr:Hsp70 family protein [Deltaproteobacteria bacterium]
MPDEGPKDLKKVATMKNILLRTQCNSPSEFIEKYTAKVHGKFFVLPKADMFPVGTELRLVAKLKGDQVVFKANGIVEEALEKIPGTPLRLTAMDPVSRGIYRRMIERTTAEDEPLAALSVDRQSIKQILSKMELISEVGEDCSISKKDESLAPKGIVLGIDLGTTNSCCAIVKEGRPFIIPSDKGHSTIPSVVAIDPMGEIIVGHAAKAQMEINPKKTVYGSKRLVGRPFESPIVRQVRDRFHYEIVSGKDGHAAVSINDKVMSLEKVSGHILTYLRDVAQDYLGKVIMRAVITVPAYYNENQRSAVRAAGQLAGLHVERILNEPTAAALAWGHTHDKDQCMLVYDLGGGTFDASILRITGNRYEVLATGGDTFLGGVDFDAQLMDHIVIEFQLELGKLPEMERVSLLRALQGAEFAKCALSSRSEYEVRLPFIARVDNKPVDLNVKVKREQLDELVGPLVRRSLEVCDEVLEQAGLTAEDLDSILLVGGQTRMPLVWSAIEERYGMQPIKGVHPDESVAVGAALLAESFDSIETLVLIDVLPISIGVGVPGGEFIKLIQAGTTVPISKTYALHTFLQNQTEIIIPVYQGESEQVDENEYLGTVNMRGIPPGPPGSRTIEVTFSLNSECLLTVSARDSQAGDLGEVIMTTHDTPKTLREKLGLSPADVPTTPAEDDTVPEVSPAGLEAEPDQPASSAADSDVPPPADSEQASPEALFDSTTLPAPEDQATAPLTENDQPTAPKEKPPAKKEKRGFWGFIKGLFGKR